MRAGFYTDAGPLARTCVRFGSRRHEQTAPLPAFGRVWAIALAVAALGFGAPAQAVDGCKVLLCMAGNWRRIAPCEPTVRQALRDVARGRAWPQCGMGGNSDAVSQGVAPVSCPEQYRTERLNHWDRVVYACPFSGVVHVAVAGQPWSRTWWSIDGDAVVEWLPAARAALAGHPDAMDTRFDDDHAAWVIAERLRRAADPQPVDPGP